jgi:phosphatidylserine decarboxylase
MRIDRAGWPFIGGAAGLAGLAGLVGGIVAAAPFLGLAAVLLFFFRDPERQSPREAGMVLSPADGRVLAAGAGQPGVAPPGAWMQVSIFLSPLDVHVNRVPASGRVTRVTFRRGRFLPAYHDAAAGQNERSEVWLDQDGRAIVFRQVVGLLARRVVCRLDVGAEVTAGDRFGVMKFGSRMDVFLPVTATLCVSVGDRVRAGVTVIARLEAG